MECRTALHPHAAVLARVCSSLQPRQALIMPAVPCTQTLLGLTEQTARERQVAQDSKARRQEAASSRQEQLKAQFLQKQVGATAGLPVVRVCWVRACLLAAGSELH